ncbi:hypothetical protein ACIRRH_33620 [Kitasatospora sp. NPDC101235]|uniref:hypothetical protein n=1 Tax=Kitasatospora sp. NPDC101235 TaxID=3364101 RepID=UPI00382100A9
MLPLLLSARQYRFHGDVEALSHHLIDTPVIGWEGIGTDLLDGAPDELRDRWLRRGPYPSSQFSADGIITPDGSPPSKDIVTEQTTGGLNWAYVLHADGIEVIGLYDYDRGPVVPWDTDPTSDFSDYAARWPPTGPLPVTPPPSPAASAARASSGTVRSATPVRTTAPNGAPAPVPLATPAVGRTR